MPLKVALLSAAHLHAGGYAAALAERPDAEIIGVWDDDGRRGRDFAAARGLAFEGDRDRLLARSDAAIVCSENRRHVENVRAAKSRRLPVLCEKPLATTEAEARDLEAIASDGVFMTTFPCRFHPAWAKAKERVAALGPIRAIAATNRGGNPGGWFVEEPLSGGGAMMDHTVHVADLLRDLLGRAPARVYAQTNSRMYGRPTDDCALLALDYEDGPFVTHDSSWSRPAGFRTWGDVTMTVVGDEGTVELDMFGPGLLKTVGTTALQSVGSDADALMVESFLRACGGAPVVTTLADGLAASRVALAAYRSARSNRPEPVA